MCAIGCFQDELFLEYECGAAKSCAMRPPTCESTVTCEAVFTVGPAVDDGTELLVEMYAVTTAKSIRAYVAATIADPTVRCF